MLRVLAARARPLALGPMTVRYFATKPDLTFPELQRLIHGVGAKYVLIDVREPSEVVQGRIPTATNIPLKDIATAFQLGDKDFMVRYGIPKPTAGEDVVFYCRSGKRSSSAVEAVEKLGLNLNLRNYRGSWLDYSANALKDQTLL